MGLSLTTQPLNSSGQFGPFTTGMALNGTINYPAIAMLNAAGFIFDPALLAQDGTDATGISPLAGAVGIRGWLSTIHNDAISPAPGAVTTNPPAYTTGTTAALSINTSGGLRVDPSNAPGAPTYYAQGSSTTGQVGPMLQAKVLATSPTYGTPTTTNPLYMDSAGNLQIGRGTFYNGVNGGMAVTASTYTPGMVVGGLLQFLKTAGAGILLSLTVTANQVFTNGLKAYIFGAAPTGIVDHAAIAIPAASLQYIIGEYTLWPDIGGGAATTLWTTGNINLTVYNIVAFWVVLETLGILTPSATNVMGAQITGQY